MRYKATITYLIDGKYKTISKSFKTENEVKTWLRETKHSLYTVSNDVIGSYKDIETGVIDENMELNTAKEILNKNGYKMNEALLPTPKIKTSSKTHIEPKFVRAICKKNNYTLIANDDEEVIFIITDIKIPTDNGKVYPVVHIEINNWKQDGQFDIGYGVGEWLYSTNPNELEIIEPKINGKKVSYKYDCYGLDASYEMRHNKSWNGQDERFGRYFRTIWANILDKADQLRTAAKANKERATIDTSSFEDKMEKLADSVGVKFKSIGKMKWVFNGLTISPVSQSSEWRIVISLLNYSYFKAKDLNEVYKIAKWYSQIPVHPIGKF